MLLGSLFVYWSIWQLGIAAGELLSVPDELLQEIAFIFGKKKILGLPDDLFQVSD